MVTYSIDAIIRMLDADYIENASLDIKIKGVCIDSRKVEAGNLYVPLVGARVNGHDFVDEAIKKGAVATLWNRSQPNPPKDIVVIIVDDTLKALQKLAKLYRDSLKMKVVGVTGSNGKTSSKDMIASLLATTYKTAKTMGNLNSDIGVPLTLLSFDRDVEVAVVEMGMENKGELSFLSKLVRPDIAIITNVGVAHLENLGSIENIARAKMEIVDGLNPNGHLILPDNDKNVELARIEKIIPGGVKLHYFGNDIKCDYAYQDVEASNCGIMVTINDHRFCVDMIGKIQGSNAACAYGVAKLLGLDDEHIQQGFSKIAKTGLRNELVKFGEAMILNDSYKSNPQSAAVALDTLDEFKYEYKIAVLADMLDLGSESDMLHFNLGKSIKDHDVDCVYTYGDMARYIAQGVMTYCKRVLVRHFETKEELIEVLKPYQNQACMILVKGSRSMKLDEVVDRLLAKEE